ncbi:terminase gpA endonuclease subunit [Aporhodopirellula aestuarii]|uniref:Phage terminase large subunit family protein n=1 Tax=Aporhodopirellula aestuarii TaxID=2950107 RepID=A0ABT0TYK7_9BACT|nr:terminase gpA endonuclease subunit [Aporhodopirellula aestuarii]MCM2369650.1 phage terminase large subunit family protein [Aporhodopirellula aestuarii]
MATDADDLSLIEQAVADIEAELAGGQPGMTRADKMRAASAKAQKAATRSSQDIGSPPVGLGDAERRKRSDADLEYHLRAYYPDTFPLEFPPELKRLIRKIQDTLEGGGQAAIALPRGIGKSSIMIRACLWAVLTGRRRYVCLISCSNDEAKHQLRNVKLIILFNRLIQADFARELFCLYSTGGRSSLCEGQHSNGTRTGVVWNAKKIASGFIEGVETNDFVFTTVSIAGSMRGQTHLTHTGETLRVDALMVDDPQTRASASSKPASRKRLETINGDALNMVGGDKTIAALAAVTIIRSGDTADSLVDRKVSPNWRGECLPLVLKWPTDEAMELWNEWSELYLIELEADDSKHTQSRKFVRDHFDQLHDSHEMLWKERFDKSNEESALHRAMILKSKSEAAFAAEQMLKPLSDKPVASSDLWDLNAEEIANRVSPFDRGELPNGIEVITAFVDVQTKFLPWMIMGFTLNGRGYVIDRGAFPDQKTNYFTKDSLHQTFDDLYGEHTTLGDQVTQAMDELTADLFSREYIQGDAVHSIDKVGFDIGFKLVANELRDFALQSPHRAMLVPMQGRYVGPDTRHWQRMGGGKMKRTRGINVALKPPPKGQRGVPTLQVDTNAWKNHVAEALTIPETSQKSILLFNDTPENHLMIGEHCEAEYPMLARGKDGTEMVIWKNTQSGIIDNDYWDCMVGCCALASTLGVFAKQRASSGVGQSDTTKRKRRKYGITELKI